MSRSPFRSAKRGASITALVVGVALHTITTAHAQTPAQLEIAKHAFEDGVALEKKGDYAGALGKFKESAQIKPTLGNRFHFAYCLEMTGKLAAALNEYEAVDKAAREQNKTELIENTRPHLESLRAKVPQLTLRIVPPPPKEGIAGMEVLIDGSPLPITSAAELDGTKTTSRVDPGEHIITAHAPDYEGFSKKIAITEGGTLLVDVTLERSRVTTAKPNPNANPNPNTHPNGAAGAGNGVVEPPAEERPSPSRALPIATTAGAIAFAGAGVALFLVAGGAQSDAEKTCLTKVSCSDEKTKVQTFDTLALAGFIGAVGLGALSVVLWVSKPSSSSASSSGTRETKSSLRVVSRSTWIALEGRF